MTAADNNIKTPKTPKTPYAPKAGVIGWPVAHSRSPLIHGHWLDTLGVDGSYEKLAVSSDDFEKKLRALSAQGFVGANVTVPHKQSAFEMADEADKMATRLRAANTLVFKNDKIYASNTDGYGFMASLKQSAPETDFSRPALVLGAGGAARAIIAALADAGVPMLYVANRSADKIKQLAPLISETNCNLVPVLWAVRTAPLKDVGLLVNATSLGMAGQPVLDVQLDGISPQTVVADIVYAPLETKLLRTVRAHGCVGVDGLGMLLHQAVLGFEAWFGHRPKVTEELRRLIVQDLQADKEVL